MLDTINSIINKWDPLDLLIFAPQDEYAKESQKVYEAYQKTKDPTILGTKIYGIFSKSFGDNILKISMNDCIEVAKNILSITKE